MRHVLENVAAGTIALALAAACYAGVALSEITAAQEPAAPPAPPPLAAAPVPAPVAPAATPAWPAAHPAPVPGGLVGAGRDRFIDNGMARCVPTESEANRGAASPVQVNRYCVCFVESLADGLTAEGFMEVYNAAAAGARPSSRITHMMAGSSRRCWAAAMARP